jgi:ATP-dependent DNA ligase
MWVHEIKHDGYRLMVRRGMARASAASRATAYDWVDRFPRWSG